MENLIISHNDLDGLISAAITVKCVTGAKIFFTSNLSFKSIFFRAISKIQNYGNIYFLDLSIRDEILKVASVLFRRVFWIDHHINEKISNLQNAEIIIDSNSKSASELVSKYFNFFTEWVQIVNEIDSNCCETEESKIIRDYFSYLRIKYGKLYNKLLNFQSKKILKYRPKDFIEMDEVKSLVSEFTQIKNEFKKIVDETLEIKNIKNYKVGIIELKTSIPPYIIFDFVRFSEREVDFIVIIYRSFKGTKLEFRSFNNFNVYRIAKLFNGGGHMSASGAYIPQNLTKTQIITKIEEVL